MSDTRLTFMCRVLRMYAPYVVDDFENFELVPADNFPGYMNIFVSGDELWLKRQFEFDR